MMALLCLLVLFIVPSVTLAILIRCGRRLIEVRLALKRLRDELREPAPPRPLWPEPAPPAGTRVLPRSIQGWMWLVGASALVCTVGVALFSDRGDFVGWLLIGALVFLGLIICPLCCLSWAYEVLQRIEKVQAQVEELRRRWSGP